MALAATGGLAPARVWLTTLDRLVLRVAFGATLAFAIAMMLDWEFAFLAPLVTATLLVAMPANPTFGQGIAVPLTATVFCNGAMAAAYLFAGAPHVLFLFAGLVICWTAYGQRRGAPAVLMLIGQISVAAVAIFSITSLELAREFTDFFQKGALAAAAVVWISHALIPAPAPPPRPAGAVGPVGLPPADAARIAFCDTLILMPLVAKFMLASDTNNIVYVSTCAILLSQLEPSAQTRTALDRVWGQVTGGVMAVMAQQFIFVADTLTHFLLTVFLATLWLARRIVGAGPGAGFFVQAMSAFILVLGLGLVEGGSELYYATRIIKISLAVLYTFAALSLLVRLRQVPASTDG